ncbi:MAG TPA: adenosylcobinamide-phosphate synthase CbiB [Rhodoplanes sp.]|nr:adenosylcobinamide-phosphate synthase CbiB [Rhodoplanes sp.]
MDAALAFLALVIELMVGYPDRLLRAIGHPVIWIGQLIGWLDRVLNRANLSYAGLTREFAPAPNLPRKWRRERSTAGKLAQPAQAWLRATRAVASDCRVKPGNDEVTGTRSRIPGVLALVILLVIVATIALFAQRVLLLLPFGFLAVAVVASSLIAQRSLYDHVARVAAALESGGLEAGRAAVSQIVGRDVAALDEAGVARAAIESLAENFSDGVVAPAFWLAVGGLPGAALYKAVNTADSMIGHHTPRHEHFGWAAARLDDFLNLPASRLSALLLIAAAAIMRGGSAAQAWRAVQRDASRHRSPNAGYPESAMAGALGLKLAGPRVYAGVCVDDAYMGDGRRDATAADIRAALALYRRADALLIAIFGMIAIALIALA